MNNLSGNDPTSPNVLVLASRDYDVMNKSGRARIFRNYLRFLSEHADVTVKVAPTLSFGGWLGVASFLGKLVKGAFKASRPLQVTFVNASDLFQDCSWQDFDVVLVDGPRLAACVLDEALLQEAGTKLIVDMDDLMSRRYQIYSDMGLPLEVGALGNSIAWMKRLCPKILAGAIHRLESRRFARLEDEIAIRADEIVFSSTFEAQGFAAARGLSAEKVIGQSWICEPLRDLRTSIRCASRPVFGFIGSDLVPQNRLAIEFLLRQSGGGVSAKLLIAGHMKQSWPSSVGVDFVGEVEDVADFYEQIDFLLVPSFVEGGVKTKVLEAAEYGIPSIGNATTFEGIRGAENALCIELNEFNELFSSVCAKEIGSLWERGMASVSNLRDSNSLSNYKTSMARLFCK